MQRKVCALAGIAAGVVLAAPALGQLANGGFETGDFTGWNIIEIGSGFIPPAVEPDGTLLPFVNPTMALDGRFSATMAFDGDVGYMSQLYQDVAVADLGAGTVASFETNHRIQYDSLGIPATLDRIFEVTVRDPGTNTVLETLFSQSVALGGPSGIMDLGYGNNIFDISSYRGQTVRLSLDVHIQEGFTGPGIVEYDAIGLEVIPAPASACLLALGALATTRRRR